MQTRGRTDSEWKYNTRVRNAGDNETANRIILKLNQNYPQHPAMVAEPLALLF